ncbi:MAG: PHP domain-containing protein, partial [Lachnospiraceae bacterium]|nr:PHP domain-containing protein [Lachnospiraceae bacterium]
TQKIVDNPMAFALEDPCVVFDIETTGFSPVEDRIIEIGAVKMRDGEVTDRFSAFVNPGVPIPYRIEQLTHISDETVRDAPPIEQVLPEFLAFAEGCYLVAHNARFDISFIREKAAQLGLSHEPFAVADTLGIARAILAGLKSFNLDTLSKELNVTLESHHRAVNDAEATAGIYAKLLSRLKHRGYRTLKDLEEGLKPSKEALKTLHPYHVILLAANETGRVNLYKLVSASCLEYFGGRPARPKIPKSLLSAHREGLIVGSACSAGELFSAVLDGASEETLRQIVSYYDYLEVQPLGNNEYLFRDGAHDVRTEEDLQALNRKILELGERYGKPVCATGDVHFLNPEDALYRAILQAGSGYKESEEQPPLYLRTTEEMLKEFEYLGAEKAYEIVVTNTNLIADRIEKIAPVRPDKCPPVIPHADEDLRDACFRRAHALYGDPLPKIVQDRLDRELTSIIGNGYAVMYMIAEKLVSKSVNDGYLVGSRGSVGSSLAATMSGITEVNPLKPHYRCPSCRYSEFDSEETAAFERKAGCDMPDKDCPVCGTKMVKDGFNIPLEKFLGFKGDKEPDIDLNFSGEYQSKAHAYTE